MRSFLVVFLLAFAFVGSSPTTAAQGSCDKQFVISQVSLPTTTQLSPSEQATIRVRLVGRCFDDRQLGELADRVRDTLQSFGYYCATVSEPTLTVVDVSRHPQPVSLNVEIVEGARYKVREISWLGVQAVSSEQVFSISQIHPEDILDTSKVRETLEAVRRLYAALGYPTASVVPRVEVHEAGHWVSLYFNVAEGAQSP
jgi:outer membrane protein assembly factor BamA